MTGALQNAKQKIQAQGDTKMRRKNHIYKKIFAMILSISLMLGVSGYSISAFASSPFGAFWVNFVEADGNAGNIFFGKQSPRICISIENPDTKDYQITASYTIKNQYGETIKSGSKSFVLGAKKHIIKTESMPAPQYGAYTMQVTFGGSFGAFSKTAKYALAEEAVGTDSALGVQYNIDDNPKRHNVYDNMQMTKDAGFGAMRDDMRWNKVETTLTPTGDKYIIPANRARDIEEIQKNEIKPILIVGDSNPLYDNAEMPYSETGIQAYAEYAAFLAKTYGTSVIYEIANEPDYSYFSGRNATGTEYAAVLMAAYSAIKNECKEATVITGGVCTLQNSNAPKFLEDMFAVSGITNYMDGLSFHPYNNDGRLSDEQNIEDMTFKGQVEYANELLLEAQTRDKTTDKDIPLYITEYGVSSRTSDEWSYTELDQAIDLVRTVAAAKSEPTVKQFVIYNLVETGITADDNDDNYGIVELDHSAKPAYIAMAFMNRVLYDAEYVSSVSTGTRYLSTRGYSMYNFKKTHSSGNVEEDVHIVWEHTDKTATLSVETDSVVVSDGGYSNPINTEGKTVTVYDMYGNVINKTYMQLTTEPVYVVCRDEQEIKLEASGNVVTVSGRAKVPNSEIALVAVEQNGISKKRIAIEQSRSDANGMFSIEVELPQNYSGACTFSLFDGAAVQSLALTELPDYSFDAQWFKNTVELTEPDAADLKLDTGDTLTLRVTATANAGKCEAMTLIGAAYGSNGTIQTITASDAKWSDNASVMEVSFTAEDGVDIDLIKFLLWKSNMHPMIEMQTITQ